MCVTGISLTAVKKKKERKKEKGTDGLLLERKEGGTRRGGEVSLLLVSVHSRGLLSVKVWKV